MNSKLCLIGAILVTFCAYVTSESPSQLVTISEEDFKKLQNEHIVYESSSDADADSGEHDEVEIVTLATPTPNKMRLARGVDKFQKCYSKYYNCRRGFGGSYTCDKKMFCRPSMFGNGFGGGPRH